MLASSILLFFSIVIKGYKFHFDVISALIGMVVGVIYVSIVILVRDLRDIRDKHSVKRGE